MTRRLKTDFHSHTSDDPIDDVGHSAEMLIDAVVEQNFDVLAITCHDALVHSEYLASYARQRGLLLIPAIERTVEGRHVVILNPDEAHVTADTFDALRAAGRQDAAFIAPHPFFPVGASLGPLLEKHIDLFDAIEFCNLYRPSFNLNRRARRIARKHGLPMVGTSDCHTLPYLDSTFTWVDAEPTVPDVIAAVREGRVELDTRPRPWPFIAHMMGFTVAQILRDLRKRGKAA